MCKIYKKIKYGIYIITILIPNIVQIRFTEHNECIA